MEYSSFARPIKRWTLTNHGETRIQIGGIRHELELNHSGQIVTKEGGMGVVYRCRVTPRNMDQTYAWIKHARIDLTSDDELKESLEERNKEIEREIDIQQMAASIGFAPLVIAKGLFSAKTNEPEFTVFVQSEAVGISFYDLKDNLDHSQRVEVLTHFFKTLQTLHENGIYHCDLDLRHVYWDADSQKINIIDWGAGIAKHSEEQTNAYVKGKLLYSPPEQWVERIIHLPQSEVYSAGAVAYFFLNDKNDGDDELPDYRDNRECDGYDLIDLEDLPLSIKDTIFKATRNQSEDRFQSMGELLQSWSEIEVQNLISLTIKNKTSTLSSLNEENTSFTDFGLNIQFRANDWAPSWRIQGDFEVFMTQGSRKGQWARHQELELFTNSKIIRPISTNGCLLLEVTKSNYYQESQQESADDTEDPDFFIEKSTKRYLRLISTKQSGEKIKLAYVDGDYEEAEVSESELNSRFTRVN